jgi:hypothetical protein
MKGNDPFLVAENEKFQRMKLTRYYEKWCLNFIMMIHILHKLSVMFLHDWDNGWNTYLPQTFGNETHLEALFV